MIQKDVYGFNQMEVIKVNCDYCGKEIDAPKETLECWEPTFLLNWICKVFCSKECKIKYLKKYYNYDEEIVEFMKETAIRNAKKLVR